MGPRWESKFNVDDFISLCHLFEVGLISNLLSYRGSRGLDRPATIFHLSEVERGTLDLLLLQGPGPARIVLGKVLAALIFSREG